MVQLNREQWTFIRKTFYETDSVNVVVIFYQISYRKIYMQNLYISIPNGARMWFRLAISIWSVFDNFMLLKYKKSIIGKLNNSSFLLCKNEIVKFN